jgi:translation initiation factor SUI1
VTQLIAPYDAASELSRKTDGGDALPTIHLRVQKRNARSFVTLIESAHKIKMLKALKRHLCCNGAIIESDEHGKIVQLHREAVREYLMSKCIGPNIKMHGNEDSRSGRAFLRFASC